MKPLVFVMVGAFVVACDRRVPSSDAATCPAPADTAPFPEPHAVLTTDGPALVYRDTTPTPSVLDVPPADMRTVLNDAYRLKPDRRFVQAVAELHHLFSGAALDDVRIAFQDGRWTIHYRGHAVGTLPAFPSYEDARALLTDWAGCLAQQHPIALTTDSAPALEGDAQPFAGPEIAELLRRIDDAWRGGERSTAAMRAAAHALVVLSLQTLDRLEIADRLFARTLATVVMSHALGAANSVWDEALLAHLLGYTQAARMLASQLPANHVVRQFVEGDTHGLRAAAEQADADRLTKHLFLQRFAEEGNFDSWSAWLRAHGPPVDLAVLRAGLARRDFAADRTLPPLIPYLTIGDAWHVTGTDDAPAALVERLRTARSGEELSGVVAELQRVMGGSSGALLARFETAVQSLDERFGGPFLDAVTYRAFFRATFYSALYHWGMHRLDALSSAPAAAVFHRTLENAPGGVGSDLYRWYGPLVASEAGRGDVTALMNELSASVRLGGAALHRTYREIDDLLGYADTLQLRAAKWLARGLDTRVDHLERFSQVVRFDLSDLGLTDAIYRAILAAAPREHPRIAAWHARFRGDSAALFAVVDDSLVSGDDRAYAIELLMRDERIPPETVQSRYRRLIEHDPDRWALRADYIDYLEERAAYDEGAAVAEAWLERNPGNRDFDFIFARTAVARMHYHAGRHAEAWRAVSPVITSGQSGALGRGALILQASGQHDRAREIAQQNVDRYPRSAWARAVSAEILWRQRRYNQAARVLDAPRFRVNQSDWRDEVGDAFLNAFRDRPLAEALAAVDALTADGIPASHVEELAWAANAAERFELAYRIQTRLTPANDWQRLEFPIKAAAYLEAWRGFPAALAWLNDALPPARRNPASMMIYDRGADELLWQFITDPARGSSPTFVWLLRAASAVERGLAQHPHRQPLEAYYAQRTGDPYVQMGRYLLALEEEAAVFALMNDAHRRCEGAYYLGVKALGDGRFEDAAAWFRVAVETGSRDDGEYEWAMDRLVRWRSAGVRPGS